MPFSARQGFFNQPTAPPPSGNLWTPADLTGVIAWFDSSDLTTITESSGSVVQWDDKSTNAFSVTADTAAEQPTLVSNAINGLSTVNFDGVDDLMYDSLGGVSSQVSGSNPVYQFVVAKREGSAGFQAPGGLSKNTNNDWFEIVGNGDGYLAVVRRDNSTTDIVYTDPNVYADQDFIMGYQYDGTEMVGRVNGGTQTITLTPGSGSILLQRLNIGGRYRTGKQTFWSGDVHQILFTDTIVSAEDQERLEGWAAHKYALTGLLPPAHPYKSAAPTV